MSLMGSLGLDAIEADPNALPDGKWVGRVSKSEYVYVPKSDSIAHVISYTVTEGSRKGATRQEWFTLGKAPLDAEGQPTKKISEVASYTPTMSDTQKVWYKKRHVDLGVPEGKVHESDPKDLVGLDVNFGTKKNGEYININFVEPRTAGTPGAAATAPAAPQVLSGLM